MFKISKELKALEILRENKRAIMIFIDSFADDQKDDDEYISANKYLVQLDDGIRELERLKDIIYEKDKKLEELQNRSCNKCKFKDKNRTYMCNVATQDFYCSEFEAKGE